MEQKHCSQCKAIKPVSGFYVLRISNRTGFPIYKSHCKQCHAKSAKAYAQSRTRPSRGVRRQRIKQLLVDLKGGRCADCGFTKLAALQFDHLDPSAKLGEVSQLLTSASLESVLVEALKCDVVCANCHAIREADRRAA